MDEFREDGSTRVVVEGNAGVGLAGDSSPGELDGVPLGKFDGGRESILGRIPRSPSPGGFDGGPESISGKTCRSPSEAVNPPPRAFDGVHPSPGRLSGAHPLSEDSTEA